MSSPIGAVKLFDDRLATVLRMSASSPAGKRTQLRQLLDILDRAPASLKGKSLARIAQRTSSLSDDEFGRIILEPALRNRNQNMLKIAGFSRISSLLKNTPALEKSYILDNSSLRLRNPEMVEFFAQGEPKLVAPVMANAKLQDEEWENIIPRLPVVARGFLRNRRDLPPKAVAMLKRLGVRDLVLPNAVSSVVHSPEVKKRRDDLTISPPEKTAEVAITSAIEPRQVKIPATPKIDLATSSPVASSGLEGEEISALLDRIARFRKARSAPQTAPRLPLGDIEPAENAAPVESFECQTDEQGQVTSACDKIAPWIIGMSLTSGLPSPLVNIALSAMQAFGHHQPLFAQPIVLDGAPALCGDWRIDAMPVFSGDNGSFSGFHCQLRRPVHDELRPANNHGDMMRQVLHELRTPVGAIQGFAEIIQQQMFGPAPHEYRAHAASISVDSARLLAGFDEIDRLAKLETGAFVPDGGKTDIFIALEETSRRLNQALAAREAGFDISRVGSLFTINLSGQEAQSLCWRVLATIAGALGPAEKSQISVGSDGQEIQMRIGLPASLQEGNKSPRKRSRHNAVSAGMFGPQFTLRLAKAEAEAIGGKILTNDSHLTLTLPVLTASQSPNSSVSETIGN